MHISTHNDQTNFINKITIFILKIPNVSLTITCRGKARSLLIGVTTNWGKYLG